MHLGTVAFDTTLVVLGAIPFLAALGGGYAARRLVPALAWLAAGAALVAAAAMGVMVSTLGGVLVLGRLGAVLLIAITLVGAIVLAFAARQLGEDPRRNSFLVAASAVVAGMALVVVGTSWLALLAGWLAAGWGFVAAHGLRRDLPGVARSWRRAVVALAIGDLALLVVALVTAGGLHGLVAAGRVGDPHAPLGLGAGALVAVAVLSRAAQGPFGGWLPGTAASPSPTGALLHAGVVNGGAILLMRLRGTVPIPALALVFVVGLGTALVASQLTARRPDVKGQLAYSTMGQMGFLVAVCAVGAYLAAVVHLVGHAWYKSNLLLGSGGRIEAAPTRSMRSIPWYAWCAGVGGGLLWWLAPDAASGPGAVVLAVLVGVTAGALATTLVGTARFRRSVVLAVLLASAFAFGVIVGALGAWMAPPTVVALSPWWLLVVVPGALLVSRLARSDRIDRILWRAALGLPVRERATTDPIEGIGGRPEEEAA